MNVHTFLHASAIATALLATNASANDDIYTVATVGANETKLLTTALASDANYDTSEFKRVCFTTIDSLQLKTENNNSETTYKFVVQGCEVTSATTGAGQCTACTKPSTYTVTLEMQTATGVVKVDDIDIGNDASDGHDNSDSDDRTGGSTKPAVGTAGANSTAPSNGSSAPSTTTTTTTTSPLAATTTSPTAASPMPTSAASAFVFSTATAMPLVMAMVVGASL